MSGNNKNLLTMFVSFLGMTSTSILLSLPTFAMPNPSSRSIEISEVPPSNSRLYSQNNGTTTTPGTINNGTTTTPGTINNGTTTTPGTTDGQNTTGGQNNRNIRALW
ncbi:MAG: hypothetical protein NHB32_23070 [Fischerella sp. CENA71]|nr:hypothetical protein [Fischerella sp. CENA71]